MTLSGRLVLCSYGLNDYQITPETLAALHGCDVVYGEPLSSALKKSLEGLCPRIQSVSGRDDGDVVDSIVAQVLKGRAVGFLTYGDPMLLNGYCERLIARCESEKCEYRVFRGVSYLNELLGGLRLATHTGSGVYLTWVSAKLFRFDVDVPALVFLFGISSSRGRDEKRLMAEIRRVYPADHEVELVSASSGPGGLRRKKYRVRALASAWKDADHRSTLYIPSRRDPA